METKDGYTAIIPARNEDQSLKISVPFLVANSQLLGEILVVVDSVDDTSLMVIDAFKRLGIPVQFILNPKPGVFGAIQAGVARSKFECILVAAADEIYPLLKFDEFALALINGSDFVTGTRYSKGGKRYGGQTSGKVLSGIANFVLRKIYRNALSDFTTGYKGFKKNIWSVISVDADGPGWSSSLKFSLNTIKAGLTISEIPIISLDRCMGGQSSFNLHLWVLGYLRKIF